MTEALYNQYPAMFYLDLCGETRVFAAIHGSSVGIELDQFIPEFGQIMFRGAPIIAANILGAV